MGTLYLVATPIGNLEDMSPRAIRILREVSLIAAEDTRHTGILLKHFEIGTPLTSYFEHNKLNKLDFILEHLSKGDVALVSDAGTPAINDPGYELVRAHPYKEDQRHGFICSQKEGMDVFAAIDSENRNARAFCCHTRYWPPSPAGHA